MPQPAAKRERRVPLREGLARGRGPAIQRGAPPELKQELEKFFVATGELGAKTLRFLGWQGPVQAKKLVRRCEKVFKKKN